MHRDRRAKLIKLLSIYFCQSYISASSNSPLLMIYKITATWASFEKSIKYKLRFIWILRTASSSKKSSNQNFPRLSPSILCSTSSLSHRRSIVLSSYIGRVRRGLFQKRNPSRKSQGVQHRHDSFTCLRELRNPRCSFRSVHKKEVKRKKSFMRQKRSQMVNDMKFIASALRVSGFKFKLFTNRPFSSSSVDLNLELLFLS